MKHSMTFKGILPKKLERQKSEFRDIEAARTSETEN